MLIEADITINADVMFTYAAFSNLDFWLATLPDVLAIKKKYVDALHQEFTMTVQRPNGSETIRGIWFCTPQERIELCQPTPPPGFKSMTGTWNFKSANDSTTVNVVRHFGLLATGADQDSNLKTKADNIKKYLTTNLQLFKTAIETTYAA